MKRAFKVITERDARKGDRQEIFLAMDWRLFLSMDVTNRRSRMTLSV